MRLNEGGNPVIQEIDAFAQGLPPVDARTFKEEVAFLMEESARGYLKFGPDGTVDFMERSRDVLELRVGDWSGGRPGKRKVRLYFTEPADRPGLLLALKLAWKVPGPMGVAEQNKHIDEAQRRYDESRDSS